MIETPRFSFINLQDLGAVTMIMLVLYSILSFWIAAIAILSVQNATAVAIQFLWFRTIELPLGVILAFGVSAGLLGVAVLRLLWQPARLRYNDSSEEEWE